MSQTNHNLTLPGFGIEDGVVYACNGDGLKHLLRAGKQWLEAHVNVVNALNVFPVPDGDTGTNMYLTMQAALEEIKRANGRGAGAVAAAAAHGALMGARGNSGVILSEFLQGIALGLKGKDIFVVEDFADAAELGVQRAYQSVVKPVEGTILTVARAAAEAARQGVETTQDLVELLSLIVEAAKTAQARTPDLLPILKEAGVTDSGGQGLVYILEGALRFINHQSIHLDPTGAEAPALQSTLGVDEQNYGYDVQFLIQGDGLDVENIRAYIDSLGQSTVVVGDARTIKVHVHVADPGAPLSYGAGLGVVSDVVVENMQQQARAFVHEHAVASLVDSAKTHSSNIATVVVVMGQGLADIFKSLGADVVVNGGQSMNPSTQELLAAVAKIQADNVLILPNNGNIILTSQQVQKFSKKRVEIVPTKTIPQGISALLSFNQHADVETNMQRMYSAAAEVHTIEVMRAVRHSSSNGFEINTGDVVGFLNNHLAGVGRDCNEVALQVLAQVDIETCEIVTLYVGRDSSQEQANALAGRINRLYPSLDTEIHLGGQPNYHYIISLE